MGAESPGAQGLFKLMRGAVASQKLDCFAPYVKAVFAAMWERELNAGDTDAIVRALNEAGHRSCGMVAGS